MSSDTKHVRARVLEMARKDERKGDWKSALRRYRRLTGLAPDEPSLHIKLGDVCLRLGEDKEAADAFVTAGQLFTQGSFDDKAAALYKRALELAPGRADVRDALIDAYRRLDRIPEAILTLEQASELADEQGDLQGALELRRQVADLDPLAVDTRLRLARDLDRVGQRDDARHEYAESLLELLRQGHFERAVGIFDALDALRPPSAPGEEADESAPEATDRLVAHAEESQAHSEAVQGLYRRVAQLYQRQRGLA